MRIDRLKIDNYGPIQDQDWELEPGMNLFFGLNESGKTLLVESMIKLLLSGNTGDFDSIGRVTGNPAGFLTIETDDGALQIPDADYTDLFPEETTTADIRNAFVIRDLDLRLPERKRDFGRADYLRGVTDRVMGSETQKIESVQERIADIGNLANKDSDLIMDRQPEKLRSRQGDAETLIDELKDYLKDCREAGILAKVREKRDKEDELAAVREQIAELQKAEKQEKLETGRTRIKELRSISTDRKAHQARTDEIEDYRELQGRIDRYREGRSDEGVDPSTYQRVGYVVALLFGLSLLAAIVSPVTGLSVISGILLVVLLYLGYQFFQALGAQSDREELIEEANYAGFEGDDLPSVYNAIQREIEDYDDEGQRLSREESETIGELKGTFDAEHDTLADWQDEIEAFAEDIAEVDREYDPHELDRLEERREVLQRDIQEIRTALNDHRNRLSTFDSEIQDISPEDYLDDVQDIQINSVEDLQEAIDVLTQFVSELNEKRDTARSAIDIFEELKEEEEQEINHLFTEDEFVVDTFSTVTDGNYTDVWYDGVENTIRVERADEQTLTPYELSQGTYDLLYLTIRLKLAQSLLDGESGFLVLDEAFVHSDRKRAQKEIQVLDRLTEDGWQIVYFSFRDSVREAIASAENGTVMDLDNLDFTA